MPRACRVPRRGSDRRCGREPVGAHPRGGGAEPRRDRVPGRNSGDDRRRTRDERRNGRRLDRRFCERRLLSPPGRLARGIQADLGRLHLPGLRRATGRRAHRLPLAAHASTAHRGPEGHQGPLEAEEGHAAAGPRGVGRSPGVGTPRRRARRRARLRRLAPLLVLPAAAWFAVVVFSHWLLTTPRFSVATVDVRGASRVPPARILAAAAVEPGTSLFRLDPRAIAGRVAAIPEIRRADVVREFPDRVVISVEERRPFTLVHSGRLHWLDEEGRLLGASPEAVVPQVPVVSGLSDDEVASMRSAPSPKALAAIALIRVLLRTGSALAAEISEIDMSRKDGPVLYTVDGVEVRLGTEEWEEQLARLEGVLTQVADQDVRAVDLRFRDQIILQRRRS